MSKSNGGSAPDLRIAWNSARHSSSQFDAFLRAQRRDLLSFLRRRSATEEDAQDAAQESFVRLFPYSRDQPASTWKPLLYRIATNVANDQLRRARSRRADQHIPLDDLDFVSEEPTPEEEMVRRQQRALLRAAILNLPPRCRQVYLLKRMRFMTNAEIARQCAISIKMVEKHLAKALAQLRTELGKTASGAF